MEKLNKTIPAPQRSRQFIWVGNTVTDKYSIEQNVINSIKKAQKGWKKAFQTCNKVVLGKGGTCRLELDLGELCCPSDIFELIFEGMENVWKFFSVLPTSPTSDRNIWSLYEIGKYKKGVQKQWNITSKFTLFLFSTPTSSPRSVSDPQCYE